MDDREGDAMAGSCSADIAEFEALRAEINTRFTILFTLIALDLAALGGGLTIVDKNTYVLAGLAAISGVLWLYWTDNSLAVNRIACYIAIVLAPHISSTEDQSSLGWEVYLRKLCQGGPTATRALFPRGNQPYGGPAKMTSHATDWYATALFGGSTPLLLVLYLTASLHRHANGPAVWLVTPTIAGLWCMAVARFAYLTRTLHLMDMAILLNEHPSADPTRQVSQRKVDDE
jgi:hypothetical protein